jgi:hypothetical protein
MTPKVKDAIILIHRIATQKPKINFTGESTDIDSTYYGLSIIGELYHCHHHEETNKAYVFVDDNTCTEIESYSLVSLNGDEFGYKDEIKPFETEHVNKFIEHYQGLIWQKAKKDLIGFMEMISTGVISVEV